MYGAECWTLRKEDEYRLSIAELGLVRRPVGQNVGILHGVNLYIYV